MKPKPEQAAANMNARKVELAAARAELERSQAYSQAATILSKLEASLAEHTAKLRNLKVRANGLEGMARGYIERETTICIGRDRDLTELANDLIAGGDLTEVISAARLPLDKTLYAEIRLPEPEDLGMIKQVDFERAAVMALDRAIKLQKLNIATMRRQAIFELSHSLADARATIARRLLAGFKDLNELADQDRGLANQLDATEIQFLKPRPFPNHVLSPEAITWLLECVGEGLIEAAEMTRLGLG
jgi:hypothetical protein